MLVISESDLNGLVTEIATRARSLIDHNGRQVVVPTITDRQLRAAALSAMFIATGEVVWPADKPLDLAVENVPRGPLTINR